jgi:hypothetical protein
MPVDVDFLSTKKINLELLLGAAGRSPPAIRSFAIAKTLFAGSNPGPVGFVAEALQKAGR